MQTLENDRRRFSPAVGRWLVSLACLLSLTACGFHLRGDLDLPAQMRVTAIVGTAPYSPLAVETRQVLMRAGAAVPEQPGEEAARLALTGERYLRRVLSVDSTGKVSEYQLRYTLGYRLVSADGGILVPQQTLELKRDYFFDPQNVLASQQREEEIREELRETAVRRMVRQLAVAMSNSGAAE